MISALGFWVFLIKAQVCLENFWVCIPSHAPLFKSHTCLLHFVMQFRSLPSSCRIEFYASRHTLKTCFPRSFIFAFFHLYLFPALSPAFANRSSSRIFQSSLHGYLYPPVPCTFLGLMSPWMTCFQIFQELRMISTVKLGAKKIQKFSSLCIQTWENCVPELSKLAVETFLSFFEDAF